MKATRVLVLGDLPDAPIARLTEHCAVTTRADGPFGQQKLSELVAGFDGLLTLLTQPVGGEVLDDAPRLRIISNYAVGVDNIDLDAARRNGVTVTNTPDVLTADTADLTWALILGVVRDLRGAGRFLREGRFRGWAPKLTFGHSLQTLTLGVIGAGRIGRAVLARAQGFGVRTLYWSRSRLPVERERELGVEWRSRSELLASSHIVSLHLPLNAQTRHMLDEEALRSMPTGGYLVNTARGALVDEAALVRVLADGHLAGAALDVFEREPEVEVGLMELPGALLVPHVGSATPETRAAMAECCVEDLIAVLVSGRDAPRRVI